MIVSARIDIEGLRRAFLRASKGTAKTLRVELSKQLVKVVREARLQRSHRFVRKTGALQDSISFEVDQSGLVGTVYINSARAPYGYWVHEGHRSWSPDRFVYNTVHKNINKITKAMREATLRALKKAGL